MNEPTFDEHGYPTEETLKAITEWKYKDGWYELLDFVNEAWHWRDFVQCEIVKNTFSEYVLKFRCVTGGWSGNEDIIEALQKNAMFWAMCWKESHRGGKHVFEVKKMEKK